ncbi:MAG: peptidylprolyl isomerase [Deltaproteobacteria bacterium]|nr:peptidylprolyl isomerase [Deltaproteobacteria bacterium]
MFTKLLVTLLLALREDGILVDRVVARVENEIILLSDLSKMVEMLTGDKIEYTDDDPKVSKLYSNVLSEMIEDKIIQMELKKMGQDITESEIGLAIEGVKKQRGLSDEKFAELLIKEGLSFEQYKDELRRQLRRTKFMEIRIRQKVKVTDEDAKLFYNQEFNPSKMKKLYDISVIFVSSLNDKANEKRSLEKIESVRRELAMNSDFAELAKRYSDHPSAASGGHIGKISKGDMREEFERIIFSLGEGEISEIIKSPEGFYVFKVNKISYPEIKEFDEAKEDIKKMLIEKETNKQFSYVIDTLKKKYTIYVNLK